MKRGHRGYLKKAAALAGLGGGLFLAISFSGSLFIRHRFRSPSKKSNRTSDLTNFAPETNYTTDVRYFDSGDGVRLSMLLLTPENANGNAVIVCHGVRHDKQSGVRYVQYLLRAGYTLACIDFRNHGDSGGSITTYGYFERHDILAAIRHLRETIQVLGGIAVLGASMGAACAIMAAATSDQIDALVLDSPFASLEQMVANSIRHTTHLSRGLLYLPLRLAFLWLLLFDRCNVPEVKPAEKIRFVRCPVFLIHGGQDRVIPVSSSKEIYENAVSEKDLWIVESAEHLGAYLQEPEQYKSRVLHFLQQHL